MSFIHHILLCLTILCAMIPGHDSRPFDLEAARLSTTTISGPLNDQKLFADNQNQSDPNTGIGPKVQADQKASDTVICNYYGGSSATTCGYSSYYGYTCSSGSSSGSTDNNCGKASTGCFASDTLVELADARQKFVGELRSGDSLWHINRTDDMIMMLDSQPTEKQLFYTISTASHHKLSLTPLHLLATMNDDGKIEYLPAQQVQLGQKMLVQTSDGLKPSPVINIVLEMKTGYYAPLTESGTIVVNGILASCYVGVKSHDDAHFWMGIFRLFYQWSKYLSIQDPYNTIFGQGMQALPNVMLEFGRLFRPHTLLIA